jgi:quercetin dioxygenase-like cupin family protein
MTERPPLKHLRPGEGTAAPLGKINLCFKAGAADSAHYFVAEMTLPPGSANPLHGHASEETIYVLDGEVEMVGDGGDRRRAAPGAVLHVPPRAAHGFVNVGAGVARLLMIGTPTQETYFRELSAALRARDPAAVPQVRARHGIETLGAVTGGR